MTDQSGERAVVLGGGMAGLLAARGLSEAYADVLVVDRHELTKAMSDAGVAIADFNGAIQWHFNGQRPASSDSGLSCVSSGRRPAGATATT